jgi:hypothetical protein
MLEASAPTFDLDDKLKKLIQKLWDAGLKTEAIHCADKLRMSLPGMIDFYRSLVAAHRARTAS